MHPEDRVLVAVMNRPSDFDIARTQRWYRIPAEKAGRGAHFEYIAFYFTAAFAEEKWSIHYYARQLGHELAERRDLLPDEPDHSRASLPYYKVQLGPLLRRVPPIASLRWRRISFIHTTWDRFEAAQEINDLFAECEEFVDRLYHALREEGLGPERCYPLRESGGEYVVSLAIPCREGVVAVDVTTEDEAASPAQALRFTPEAAMAETEACLSTIRDQVDRWGGALPLPPSA